MKRVARFSLKVVFFVGFCIVCFTGQVRAATLSVVDFVQEEYDLGVPCEEASAYTTDDAETLVAMLKDPASERYWENVVVTLGCIGDPVAVEPLKAFLEKHRGKVSMDTYAALLNVPTALGFITHSGDEQSMQLLATLADKSYWEQARLSVFDNVVVDSQTVNQTMLQSTIVALGFSGQAQAQSILEKMKGSGERNAFSSDEMPGTTAP